MIEQILAAVFVIGLLLVTVWVLRRKGLAAPAAVWKRGSRSTKMQVLERLQLTAHHSLHLVELGDDLILIGVSPSSCSQITALKTVTLQAEMRPAI